MPSKERLVPPIDPKSFWNAKILGWEDSRYKDPATAPSLAERIAGRVSTSLRFRLEEAVRLLAPHLPGRRVVELGCGSGLLAERLLALGAASYQGFDISDAAIARARSRHHALAQIETVCGPPGSLSLPSSPGLTGQSMDPRVKPGDDDMKRRPSEIGNLTRPMTFDVAAVEDLGSQGDALIFSLGLFDWLSSAEIAHVFSIGRQGSYFHAVAERRRSVEQIIHRAYVHFSYGRRTGYAPRYHATAEIDALLSASGRPPAKIYRHARMRFGIFVTDLTLPD